MMLNFQTREGSLVHCLFSRLGNASAERKDRGRANVGLCWRLSSSHSGAATACTSPRVPRAGLVGPPHNGGGGQTLALTLPSPSWTPHSWPPTGWGDALGTGLQRRQARAPCPPGAEGGWEATHPWEATLRGVTIVQLGQCAHSKREAIRRGSGTPIR